VAVALGALAVVQLLFGAMPVLGKLALPAFGAGGVVIVRIGGAAVAFTLARLYLCIPNVTRADLPRLIGCAVLGVVSNQLLFMNGLARTSAAHAALLTTTIPAITLLISIAFGMERATGRRIFGILVAGTGAALLILSRETLAAGQVAPTESEIATSRIGDALILCNSTVYSFYLVLSRPLLARHHAVSVLSGLFGVGFVLALPFTGLPLAALHDPSVSVWSWVALGCMVLGPTIGAYSLNLLALRVVPPSTVALWIYAQPVVAAALAVPLLGEQVTQTMVFSGALTFLGMWLGG